MTSHNLPAVSRRALPVTPIRASAQGIQRDLGADLRRAAAALRGMPDQAESDITVTASAAIVVTGRTPADALLAAAHWCRNAPHATVHSLTITRSPGPREGLVEHRLTLGIAFPDETGEYPDVAPTTA
ncbi:hypothetical protein [Kitasatospora sp. NPDC059160]|uniref:hypothetical protein n=1 Tax=Kitasatospora sp. NPDC059160 TaxID=3346748 RepID=UPI00367D8B91